MVGSIQGKFQKSRSATFISEESPYINCYEFSSWTVSSESHVDVFLLLSNEANKKLTGYKISRI